MALSSSCPKESGKKWKPDTEVKIQVHKSTEFNSYLSHELAEYFWNYGSLIPLPTVQYSSGKHQSFGSLETYTSNVFG